MTLSEMKERKRELGYSYEQIAERSGVPLSTIQKVFSGATQSPRYDTLSAIESVLGYERPSMIRESTCPYGKNIVKKQGEYTIADYYNWPEEERIELIDGVIYDMPIDVQLDCDNKTMLQPDIVVVCNRDKLMKNNIFGAPDFVVEVLSPSTRKKDLTIKLQKYTNAGVREYWIVDPQKEMVIVYDIEHDLQVSFYTFENQVPVKIFNDACMIDFKEIKDYLEE